MEGDTVVVEFEGTVKDPRTQRPVEGVFSFIDNMVNHEYKRVLILISDSSKKKEIEDWLIDQHHPMLANIVAEAVIVSNQLTNYQAIISTRANRFTNWFDIERYFY